MQNQQIPFTKLRLSPANARKSFTEAGIDALAVSIDAYGLLQPIIVSPATDKKSIFDVHAGGRRWRAIAKLIESGQLPKNTMVDTRVCNDEKAALAEEISLAENLIREAMLGHVSRLSFDRKNKRMVCLFQAARSAYPKSWRRAAWNKHLRGGCGIVPLAIGGDESVTRTPLGLSARLSAPHI